MLFTKVYKEEDVRLRGCSYNVASVYFHLKNKRDYFKKKNNGTCYDLIKYISEYMGISESTIKRAIATLKELGLIEATIKGKVNHYSFPILEAIERGETPQVSIPQQAEEKPVVKIAASKQSSNMERVQELINTDDDFYRVYNNCIKAVVEYKLSNGNIIKANSKDMAMQKLKDLCHLYQIPYNEETHNFILKDVNYSISNMGNYSVA